MKAALARVAVKLAEQNANESPELINVLNAQIKPPEKIDSDDVHIRAMYVVSDQVNSFGGCFPSEEHSRLTELLVDSPVMVGHRKDKLPIGRTFHAMSVQRSGENWVKSYFYWLRTVDGAETLKDNIDGGIYKECSVAFNYLLPECSICGEDIRQCKHEPFGKYRINGESVKCHYNYRQIERVLETSIVYRGAVPNTSISKELSAQNKAPDDRILRVVSDLSDLDPSSSYTIVPRYEGISVQASCNGNRASLLRRDGTVLPAELLSPVLAELSPEQDNAPGLLVGYRGKQRQSVESLMSYLDGEDSPVSRLNLWLYPGSSPESTATSARSEHVRPIPFRVTDRADALRAALEITTRDGVELWPTSAGPWSDEAVLCMPKLPAKPEARITIGHDPESGRTVCEIADNGERTILEVVNFDLERFLLGRRFFCRAMETDSITAQLDEPLFTTRIRRLDRLNRALKIFTNQSDRGAVILRPARLNGESLFLINVGRTSDEK
jgi:hypothetical protein